MDKTGTNDAVPLVSVICRSVGRASLTEALDSVQRQSWRPLQLVLVDAGGDGLNVPDWSKEPGLGVELVSTGSALNRPQAANAGLGAARGDYLMFLDDDDWIAPDHISTLVAVLESLPDTHIAYTDVVVATADGQITDKVFSRDFDATLLKRDNYIPIHAVLFSRTLIEKGCRFDESLPIYEDWDFWLQCSALGNFTHISSPSAFYRQGGDSDTALEHERDKYRPGTPQYQARVSILQKWLNQWRGEDLNAIIGSLDNSEHVRNLEVELKRVAVYAETLESSYQQALTDNRLIQIQLNDLNPRYAHALNEKQQLTEHLSALQQDHIALQQEHHSLQGQLTTMRVSRSWRYTKLLRWLESKVRRTNGSQNQ